MYNYTSLAEYDYERFSISATICLHQIQCYGAVAKSIVIMCSVHIFSTSKAAALVSTIGIAMPILSLRHSFL